MRYRPPLTPLSVALAALLALLSLPSLSTWAQSPSLYAQAAGDAEQTPPKERPRVEPNPLRTICAMKWDAYYEDEKLEIEVSTRGKENETLVFFCQLCSLEGNFIEPFLNTPYRGMTGMERIKQCGFKRVVFKGGAGINEVLREVPQ